MSQSGQYFEAESPKGTENEQNRRETETTTDAHPACCASARDETEWRALPFAETLGEFYRPCQHSDCYGGKTPDPTITERVVISRNFPSVFHRMGDGDLRTGQDETTDDRLFADPVFEPGEQVATLVDFCEGDGVVWNPPQIPLTVVGAAAINLRGPAGGEYTLVEAERSDARYAIYDGYGCVSGVSRVPARDRPEGV